MSTKVTEPSAIALVKPTSIAQESYHQHRGIPTDEASLGRLGFEYCMLMKAIQQMYGLKARISRKDKEAGWTLDDACILQSVQMGDGTVQYRYINVTRGGAKKGKFVTTVPGKLWSHVDWQETLYICESIDKAAVMTVLGYKAMGLSGVSTGFTNKKGFCPNFPHDKLDDETVKRVAILFDSDTKHNYNVGKAIAVLAGNTKARHPKTKIEKLTLPAPPAEWVASWIEERRVSGKTAKRKAEGKAEKKCSWGIDDYFMYHGEEGVTNLLVDDTAREEVDDHTGLMFTTPQPKAADLPDVKLTEKLYPAQIQPSTAANIRYVLRKCKIQPRLNLMTNRVVYTAPGCDDSNSVLVVANDKLINAGIKASAQDFALTTETWANENRFHPYEDRIPSGMGKITSPDWR
jgi:hypothetical protein